jgi:hypothetical protein
VVPYGLAELFMSDHETEAPEKPPISITKRLLLGSGVFVLLLVALGIGQRYSHSSHARSRLTVALADLDESDPGWRLEDLERARPVLSDAENSARVVLAAHKLVPRGSPNPKVTERFDKLPPPPELLDAERAELLDKEMTSLAAALAEARKLADMPNGRHTLVYAANPMRTLLPHAQNTREIASLLHYDALNLAQQGKARESLRSCQAALNAGRSMDDEPIMISQLVRMACVALAAGRTERTLALGEPPAEDLARLQALVELEEAHPTALVGLRGERALLHQILNGLADGSIPATDLLDRGREADWVERLVLWDIRGMARREHPRVMELMGKAIDNARLPAHEQATAEKVLQREVRQAASNSYLIRLLVPATSKFTEATLRKTAQMRCLMTVLALERYRREKGAWPAKLEDLTPKLLKKVPLDPYDGKPLRYIGVPDGVIVYSVGPDGIDNGGKLERTIPFAHNTDLGYQLWDVKHRRQPPKPAPKPPAPMVK